MNEKTYKIVHREFGSTGYFIDNLEEAKELVELMIALRPEYATQYYIREI